MQRPCAPRVVAAAAARFTPAVIVFLLLAGLRAPLQADTVNQTGSAGTIGTTGSTGATGQSGANGINGSDGPNGVDGTPSVPIPNVPGSPRRREEALPDWAR